MVAFLATSLFRDYTNVNVPLIFATHSNTAEAHPEFHAGRACFWSEDRVSLISPSSKTWIGATWTPVV
jgi:hypothetical protein